MQLNNLSSLIKSHSTIDKNGILVSKEIAEKTVWDKLAIENPTHAVISASNEEEAARKSIQQITDIKKFLKSEDILLDLGTGYGRVAKYLLPEVTLGGYIGVDSSYEMLSLFKQRYKGDENEQKTPLLLVNADMHTLPFNDSSVDVIIVCAVFLHNHKNVVSAAMSEVGRVVKPGGKVLVYSSFPRAATIMGLQGHTYQIFLNLLGRPFKNGPVRYYRAKEINKLFADFSEVKLNPSGFSVLPKSIIFLPRFLDKFWRLGIANPVNQALEKITPARLKPYFAVHYDVVARR